MRVSEYLFSFRGRINRAKLWLFVLVVIVVEIVLFAVFAGIFGISAFTVAAAGKNASSVLFGGMVAILFFLVCLAIILALFIAGISLTVRRLHDRDKGAAWLLVFWGLPFVLDIVGATFSPHGPDNSGGMGALALICVFGALGITIWGFVEFYCLRGTVGENRYGPDPLA
jgi:uncharacterized membrane protein YhaH (DUF805 family)